MQIQIPTGMRDLFPEECTNKEEMKRRILNVFRSYGYAIVETPLIEYYATYQNTFDSIKEEQLYKFMDDNGQILALRTDMTLPIARLCATKLGNVKPPFRFCYASNVYKVRQSFAGKRNEVTDCGIELIGLDKQSDPEVVTCAIDTLEALGLKEYTFEIGNSDIFKQACALAGVDAEDRTILADLIDRKSMIDLKDFLSQKGFEGKVSGFFRSLPLANGENALAESRKICFDEKLVNVISQLEKLQSDLLLLKPKAKISFDLGKVPHLNYYTGIIFEAFIPGIGTSILSGGRYDTLLQKLGRDLPACGFGIKLDYLLEKEQFQQPACRKLLYPADRIVEALMHAEELRKEGPVELVPWDQDKMEVVK